MNMKKLLATLLAVLMLAVGAVAALSGAAAGVDEELEAQRIIALLGAIVSIENELALTSSTSPAAFRNQVMPITLGILGYYESGDYAAFIGAATTKVFPLVEMHVQPDYIDWMLLELRIFELYDTLIDAAQHNENWRQLYEDFWSLARTRETIGLLYLGGMWTEIVAIYYEIVMLQEAFLVQNSIAFPPRWDSPFDPNQTEPTTTTSTTTTETITTEVETTTVAETTAEATTEATTGESTTEVTVEETTTGATTTTTAITETTTEVTATTADGETTTEAPPAESLTTIDWLGIAGIIALVLVNLFAIFGFVRILINM
ncbi:MAG: hypothetical protein FWE40_06670 [Oscillospiraceae bacterium]|nr:hypothetical protein [Oscillospiraceae bacterium]